ncbi:signal peptidase I [Rossellomorea aquimaris]|uniref:signal peptidase I n=1 Tax=Rossellomorea aquimaris TaxID=189382 RepID=UPI001CD2D685|nr:signal peptidase I [Rossellomorea aquimaris]MCA1058902.1 signal peptidase I [Rossellomorea aquimaris]
MVTEKRKIWGWAQPLIIGVVLAFIIRSFIIIPIVVEGASMNATLLDQDRMIVNKMDKPERFDIIVFHATNTEDYIKRVIGLPGDKVEYKNDTLYINGKAYAEPYLDKQKESVIGALTPDFTLEDTPVKQLTVPDGELFVMGDNRRYSKDSRQIGSIPIDKVVGTTNIVYWPVKEMKIIKK